MKTETVVAWAIAALLVGIVIGAVWMYQHQTCGNCQDRWRQAVNALRRQVGMAIIPNE